jgi:hypothetical protein
MKELIVGMIAVSAFIGFSLTLIWMLENHPMILSLIAFLFISYIIGYAITIIHD